MRLGAYYLTDEQIELIVASLREQATHGFGDPHGRQTLELLADHLEDNPTPEGND